MEKQSPVMIILEAIALALLIYGICGDTMPHQIAKIVSYVAFPVLVIIDIFSRW